MRVIAMAYGKRPLDRALVRDEEKTVFIAADQTTNLDGTYRSEGLGFPRVFVFRFNESLLNRLTSAWDRQASNELEELWNEAIPV